MNRFYIEKSIDERDENDDPDSVLEWTFVQDYADETSARTSLANVLADKQRKSYYRLVKVIDTDDVGMVGEASKLVSDLRRAFACEKQRDVEASTFTYVNPDYLLFGKAADIIERLLQK